MSIIRRGEDTYLVRVYVGRDPLTHQRVEVNETVRGTLASAKKLEARIKGQKDSGRITKTPRMTFNMLLDLYLDAARHGRAESTQHKDTTFLGKYVRPYLGTMLLRKITSKLLQDLFNLLMDKKKDDSGNGRGLAPNTVKTVKKVLAAAFNYAVRQKLITDSPVLGIRLPPVTESKADSLTFEEAEALVSVKDNFWYGDAFVFQLHTGLRPQELMSLIWEDVDFEQGTLRIERACIWIDGVFRGFGPPKTKMSNRIIELAPQHLDLLRHHFNKQREAAGARKASGEHYGEPKIKEWATTKRLGRVNLYSSAELIFPKPDGRVPNSITPRLEFKEALCRAGVTVDYRWYDLRHTHASILIKLGSPLTDIAARMGHSLAELVSTYSHVMEGERSNTPDLFAKRVPI
jgi:integrase